MVAQADWDVLELPLYSERTFRLYMNGMICLVDLDQHDPS